MSDEFVRVGMRWFPTNPAADLYGIPYREAEDDGRICLGIGESVPCADCGVGTLIWAEAGYVPWHRICNVCGSHWSLHPVVWGPARPTPRAGAATAEPYVEHSQTCRTWSAEGVDDCHLDPGEGEACSCGVVEQASARQAARAAQMDRSGGLVRWVDGRGEVPIDPDERVHEDDLAPTWGTVIALLRPEHWLAAEREASRMAGMVVVPFAWARRAHFVAR